MEEDVFQVEFIDREIYLRMTAAEAVETSVTNSLSQDYTNLNDLPSPTCTDSPGFKPFTLLCEI